MKDTDWVWGAAAVVIFIGIYTHTPYIQNFIRKVKNQQAGYYYADPTFDYRGTESIPRVSQDQLEEMYPEDGLPPHPNQHLCTAKCMKDSCDSQGYCIDSGCGSVIHGGKYCKDKKHINPKTREKSHKNTLPHITVGALPDIEIPALNPEYNQQPSSDQDLTSPSTPSTDVSDNPFDNLEGDQQQIQPTVPTTSPTPPAPPQHVYVPPPKPTPTPTPTPVTPPSAGTPVGYSHPTKNKNFTNGCGYGNDKWVSCRAGIGTGSNGSSTPESGNDTTSVSDRIGNAQHFYAIYTFNVTLGKPTKGHPFSAEITGGYNGSNNSEPAVGVTIGVNGDGSVLGRTEDHFVQNGHQRAKGDYNELCKGNCGGVSKVPLGTYFQLVWCADKDASGNVYYRGYCRTGGKEYLIAYLVNPHEGGNPCSGCRSDGRSNPIDFTIPGRNTYLRGRTNQMGNTCPTGILYAGTYTPPSNVVTSGSGGWESYGYGPRYDAEAGYYYLPIRRY